MAALSLCRSLTARRYTTRRPPPPAGVFLYSVSEAIASAVSNGGANNEAKQALRAVLLLESVFFHSIAQPPLDGVVERIDGTNRPSPAPSTPRILGFGHVCHVAPFLADGSSPHATTHAWRGVDRACDTRRGGVIRIRG
jgi:hypothetical protein